MVLLPPNPPAQLPLIQESPNGFGVWNTNFEYTPIAQLIQLTRNIPLNTTVNTDDLVLLLIQNGGLTVYNDSVRLNAPAVEEEIEIGW